MTPGLSYSTAINREAKTVNGKENIKQKKKIKPEKEGSLWDLVLKFNPFLSTVAYQYSFFQYLLPPVVARSSIDAIHSSRQLHKR